MNRWPNLGARIVGSLSVFAGAMTAGVVAKPDTVPATLRAAGGDRLLVGSIMAARQQDDPPLARLLGTQFGCVTPENDMKPDALQRERGRFTFENADRIVAFAKAKDMAVIGHTLVWHHQSPAWLYEDADGKPLPRAEALANMKTHVQTVVRHFKGKVKGWDVVNEALPDGPGALRDTPARRAIGDDYIVHAFRFAHEADPDAELYYNDYNIDLDYKRDRAVRLIKQLQAAGVRLDAVGIQGHYRLETPSVAEVERGIEAFAALGVKVMITELDVDPLPRAADGVTADLGAVERAGLDPYKTDFPPAAQRQLADRYAALFGLFRKHPAVTHVTFWGVDDGHSWLNGFPVRGRTNHPLLWDRNYQPKPAFDAVCRVLARP